MRTSSNTYNIAILNCSHDQAWYRDINKHIIIEVSDSGDPDEWYITSGEHEGKHVAKADCDQVLDISA